MNLKSFLSVEHILVGLTATTQREMLEKLTAPLVADNVVTDAAQFVADLERREAQISTMMENGVALPHARSHVVRRLGLTIGLTTPAGVHFNVEKPEETSYVFFCIAVPSFAPTAHIPLLQALAKFSRDPRRIEKLLSSQTAGVAVRYLSAFKG